MSYQPGSRVRVSRPYVSADGARLAVDTILVVRAVHEDDCRIAEVVADSGRDWRVLHADLRAQRSTGVRRRSREVR